MNAVEVSKGQWVIPAQVTAVIARPAYDGMRYCGTVVELHLVGGGSLKVCGDAPPTLYDREVLQAMAEVEAHRLAGLLGISFSEAS